MNELTRRVPITQAALDAGSLVDRALRKLVLGQLAHIAQGRLIIEDGSGRYVFGGAATAAGEIRLSVTDPRFYRTVAGNGSVGAGEAYAQGWWSCNDLVGLVRLLVRNREVLDGMEHGLARIGSGALRLLHRLRRNTQAGSRRNIAAHYDLGNDFFALFLSPDLMYSSALWEGEDDTLAAASTRKLERICQRLALRPTDHVLEIGTGWGGFALHAARHYGCRVTTTTISAEQRRLAIQRVAEAGLSERITVLAEDYRELSGKYDKLVSIEMMEAIGAEYLPTFFRQLERLLHRDGLALIQAITIEDHRYASALRSVDFIKRHIFPGSFIPSINAMLAANTQSCDLGLHQLEDFGISYARTLQAWRGAFLEKLAAVRAQGFDERFIRAWEFYLAYCEGGFRERSIGVAHLLLARPDHRPVGFA
jgi:cyclopropane-fatty-acyl-phospholipid synthase